MSRNRRTHSASFKAKVALEAAREEKTLSQLSSAYGLHANQISDWKKNLLSNASTLFEKPASKAPPQYVGVSEEEQAACLAEIGRLQMENNFLKKKLKQLNLD
jgi:transposase-like protein